MHKSKDPKDIFKLKKQIRVDFKDMSDKNMAENYKYLKEQKKNTAKIDEIIPIST